MQCYLSNSVHPASLLHAFYTFQQIETTKSAYPCNQDHLWDGSSFQEQGFGEREGCKRMKKKIQLLYQKGYGINKLGKGQDKPQAALITELSYCIRMKIFFWLDHSLFLWQTKGILQNITRLK